MIQTHDEVKANFPALYYGERLVDAAEQHGDLIDQRRHQLLENWSGRPAQDLDQSATIRAYRLFHEALGLNPEKTRPSVEDLIIRCVRKGYLPAINNVVDACNITAATFLLAMAVFDLDKFIGTPVVRYSDEGERFQAIGRTQPEALRGRQVVLCDERNAISIFARKDSELYKIQPTTKKVLLVACRVEGIPDHLVTEALAFAGEMIGGSSLGRPA